MRVILYFQIVEDNSTMHFICINLCYYSIWFILISQNRNFRWSNWELLTNFLVKQWRLFWYFNFYEIVKWISFDEGGDVLCGMVNPVKDVVLYFQPNHCQLSLFRSRSPEMFLQCSPINLLLIFRTPFYKNAYGGLLLNIVILQHAASRMMMCSSAKHNTKVPFK